MAIPSPIGLTAAEASERLKRFGYNTLSQSSKRSLIATLWAEAREPMVMLLLICGVVYLAFGDMKEAVVLLGSVILVIGITLFQERKTERALEALRNLSSPRASVIRDGKAIRIPGRDVVPDDMLLLEEGDRVPADATLLSGSELRLDESLLTGESLAVAKEPPDIVFASTLVVRGRAHARVQATGAATEVGKIGSALGTVSSGHSPLHREIDELVKILATVAISLCLLTVIGLGLLRGDWREGLLAGLTLAMALLPEEFPVVLTVFFALGAYRIARQRVLTRRLPALEALGSASVLCADKTGTMTENRMAVTHFMTAADFKIRKAGEPLDSAAHDLAVTAALACPLDSFDPVDQAASVFGALGSEAASSLPNGIPIHEYPLSPERPMIAEVYRHDGGLFIALKGAPEAVARMCRWTTQERTALPSTLEPLAANGLRIIAVAQAAGLAGPLPDRLEDIPFKWVGLLGMTDPLRAGVRDAVQDCRSAGIQVIMITGDYPQTAAVIARQAGLRDASCITGKELETMSEETLEARLPETDIYARFTPLHKLRLVQALRKTGATVAMTGDGVNDAPALKAAHIGVAMGGRGTDVAREAADLVVLDDNFVSIVGAIRMGRRIYSNLRKSLAYLVSVHVPIAGMALLPLAFGWPLFFTPVHIVFLELIIDPACSLVFEGEPDESDVMKQPPRPRHSRLLNRQTLIESIVDGLMVLAATAAVFGIGLTREAGEMDARALGFATLVFGNLVLILVHRTQAHNFLKGILTPNKAWLAVTVGATTALGCALYIPVLRNLFKFSFLHWHDVALLGAGLGVLILLLGLVRLSVPLMRRLSLAFVFPCLVSWASIGWAQDHHHHEDPSQKQHEIMKGMYGTYAMTREASGTSWQPESTPHLGLNLMAGDWSMMFHGYIYGIYDEQGSNRGDNKWFSESMFMAMAQRPLGPGTFGLRSMMSLDPAMGKNGYPLLLQTGETADGHEPLIDRQHPHDLFMELAATYSLPMGADHSVFGYFGLPGEPALGPPAFMHRFSGVDNPAAPISHHWLDSTHITYGVATVGYVWKGVKLEGSTFKGREPDQYRWDIEEPKFDSYSGRLSVNPSVNWSLQTSLGYLKSPEQLEPDVNQHRVTASAIYNRPFQKANWQSTLAWGQNKLTSDFRLDAYLLESAYVYNQRHTLFARAERAEKNELFAHHDPQAGQVFTVHQLSLGYIRDFATGRQGSVGVGGVGMISFLPASLEPAYGNKNPLSFMLFIRARLI